MGRQENQDSFSTEKEKTGDLCSLSCEQEFWMVICRTPENNFRVHCKAGFQLNFCCFTSAGGFFKTSISTGKYPLEPWCPDEKMSAKFLCRSLAAVSDAEVL